MNQNEITVETRAWVDEVQGIEEKIEKLGAKYIETLYIEDEFYANLTAFNIEQHTFEQSGKAARIRTVTDKNNKCTVIAQIREVPKETQSDLKLHDVTVIAFQQQCEPGKKGELIEELKKRGFESLVTKISKERKVYSLDQYKIYIDDINGFSKALETKAIVINISDAGKVKAEQGELMLKLGVPPEDFIEKSHTHLIIDSYFKSQPKLKEQLLKNKLEELVKEKEKLMLESEECYREGGDGWHDNARWDILRENIDVISIRIAKLRDEIYGVTHNP